jgi:hypothetical protein
MHGHGTVLGLGDQTTWGRGGGLPVLTVRLLLFPWVKNLLVSVGGSQVPFHKTEFDIRKTSRYIQKGYSRIREERGTP